MSTTAEDEPDEPSEQFVETDDTGRYGRYNDLLGSGSSKKVYRGFDLVEGFEIAWNQIDVNYDEPQSLERPYSEVCHLRDIHHENIIRLYSYWTDEEHQKFNFITEICTSGSLRDYRAKHRNVSTRALKKWSLQILRGLDYLHNHDPCIIHRDLNCSNIFINGNTGEVMIGDFGLATTMKNELSVHTTMVGTPEFMAPEQFNECYTEGIDIYSFGFCVLEMVTREIPYSECENLPRIYKRVTMGVKPESLRKVEPEIRKFIEKCIAPYKDRPTASELLEDPFFEGIDDDDNNNENVD